SGGSDGFRECRRLVVEEALDGPEVRVDGRTPRARPVVFEQAQRELLQRHSRSAAKQGRPQRRPVARESAEHIDMRMTRDAQPIARAPGRRMSDEAKQTHEREKRLTRDLARTKCAVQLEGCERARCCGQAKARVDAVELDSDEGIEERKGARDVPPRA